MPGPEQVQQQSETIGTLRKDATVRDYYAEGC